jgi:hypothetical protein
MTPDQLAALYKQPGFPAMGKELIAVVGLTAAATLMTKWSGNRFRVPVVVGGKTPPGKRRWTKLVDVVGERAAECIVRQWPGGLIYIPGGDVAERQSITECVKREYDRLTSRECGLSHDDAVFELVIQFGLNYRSIERHLNRTTKESEDAPKTGWEQVDMFLVQMTED